MGKHTLTARRLGLTAVVTPLTALSNFILLPILTRNLAIAEYGAWALIIVTLGVVPRLATLGLPTAMTRFLAAATDKREIQEAFYSTGLTVLLASLIVSGLLLLFVPQIAASLFHNDNTIALLLIPNILLACLTLYGMQYFVAFQQIKTYAVLTIFNAYLNTVLIAYAVLLGHGIGGAMVALLIQQLVVFVVMSCLIVARLGAIIPKFRYARQYLAFGMPLIPASVSEWIVDSSDRYLIAFFLGAAAVGYYSPAYALGSTLAMVSAPLSTLLLPLLSKHYDDGQIADVRTIASYSLKYYLGLVLPCVFVVSVLSEPLLLVLTTQQIAANAYLVTPLVAAGTALAGASTVFIMILGVKNKTAVVGTIAMLTAALNFGLNLVLIPYLGLIGAAFTTFLAFLLAFVLTAYYSRGQFTFDVNGSFIVKSVCSSSIIALLLFLWDPSEPLSVVLSIVCAAIVYVTILLALKGLTIQEVKLVYRVYRGSS